ncbi:UDP-N-acetylmuramate: L-alanyl-gamma-D-glutamyl-meso-diaminopimelate ligase [Pedobacter cryoconitis]|uniref:UDP-N-acetylmuramate: L-alanyl-gamma-D-glutamyl-meso-diaminopimelate ligase n=1 Tax=Pedobacter cryoconitis TaxID=188932 RepID=A0A7W8ZIY0_9SPHI|nr:Mur ligase family protein [Pedobacter cryoconitis]MBB5634663.1 UDP-N-acetylmuramate: L-alanyl-gamma-D-glutamyl-meso-diaminopimelate ligase [Pedobacter cryoconitis]MBB6272206.1 UDP-N-acetylmuramate: L-alanyl-gamma-D-glutamyl-meso-diaminopimelate ligase [Pedobacter cryoconitis]
MRIHFIAIGGSAMHNLAIALHKKGFIVSGSDDLIFEPSASRLSRFGIFPEQLGWHEELITPDLDAVILGMHALTDNPELLKAQELGIKVYSYPEYIYEQTKDKLRVVIGGSHGKTTITSMILHVLNYYKKDFDYLVGAQLEGFDTMVKVTDSAPLIIIEGDEYLASPIDRRPKFHLYKANIAVISGVAWDHVNVFPTFENYLHQFDLFIDTIEPGGKLFYCENDKELHTLVVNSRKEIVKTGYEIPAHCVNNGITYLMPENLPLKIFGDHNLMNLSAAKLVCKEIGISEDDFNNAITSFKGAAKRLELLNTENNTNIYKDFAHSPSKLKATIEAVKSQFEERKLVACIELHTFSSLNKNFLLQYADTMIRADNPIVYIDIKTFQQKKIKPFTEIDVQTAFRNDKLTFFDNASTLEQYLRGLNFSHTNLLLMSSGNFGGMDLVKLARELNT